MQKPATKGMQGGIHCILKQVAPFFLGLILEPHEELTTDPIMTWVIPYEQLSTDQQKAAWFMDGRQFQWKNSSLFGILWH